MSAINANEGNSKQSIKPFPNFVALGKQYEKCFNFIEKCPDPEKMILSAILVPLFVYLYLAMLKDEKINMAHSFFSLYCKRLSSISRFSEPLEDLLLFRAVADAKKHPQFLHYVEGKCRRIILNFWLEPLIRLLQQDEEAEPLLLLVERICNVKRSQFTPIPSIVVNNEMANRGEISTASSLKFKESTNQWIEKPGTSSSLRSEDQNISNCSQSTADSSIVTKNTTSEIIEKPEIITTASSVKRKGPVCQLNKKPRTSSSPSNTDTKREWEKFDLFHCIVEYGGLEVKCGDVNQENTLFACGFENSTILVGTLDLETTGPEAVSRNKTLRKRFHSYNLGIPEYVFKSEVGVNNCLTGHSDGITGLAYAPSGILMSCSDDTTAQAWGMSDFKNIFTYRGHGDQIKDIAVSDDGGYFATASLDCTARLWKFERRTPSMNFHHSFGVEHLRFDPNSKYLATVSAGRIIQLWSMKDGKSVWKIPDPDTSKINHIAVSPNGKHIAYADEKGCIKIWDLPSRKLYSQLLAHHESIYCIGYNSNSSSFVSCGGDRQIILWDAKKSSPPPVTDKRLVLKGITGRHEVLSRYYAANFDPLYASFRKKDFVVTIGSKTILQS